MHYESVLESYFIADVCLGLAYVWRKFRESLGLTGDESIHAEFKPAARLSVNLTLSRLEGLFQC